MKLFTKFVLCATLVICITLLLSGYMLITSSYERALNRERERAMNQYQYDKFTVQVGLLSNADLFYEGVFQNILSDLSSDLSGFTVFFSEDETLLYTELPSKTDFSILSDISDNLHAHQFLTIDEESYIVVGGKLTQSGITLYLLVATDISTVVAQKEEMIQSFIQIYFIMLMFSMVAILILSAMITRPIKRMSNVAAGIAQENYKERLSISSKDEIGELSKSFNLMADAVENKINELSKSVRQKEDFVANFAHELKTPLTSVIGYADMLYQKTLPYDKIKEAAWYILNEGLRLEALSLKLIDLIVLNRQEFMLEELYTDELFTNIVGSLKPIIEERKVSLYLKVHPAYIMVEYDLFKTLLLNLIDNAMKSGGDKIDIMGECNENGYSVSVSDNGRGIPKSELTRITEEFYMIDKSRSYKQHGAGLGLSLVVRIAEIHGGSLEIDSEENVGTIARVDLAYGRSDEHE
jgi:Signal transduction histidine kinase